MANLRLLHMWLLWEGKFEENAVRAYLNYYRLPCFVVFWILVILVIAAIWNFVSVRTRKRCKMNLGELLTEVNGFYWNSHNEALLVNCFSVFVLAICFSIFSYLFIFLLFTNLLLGIVKKQYGPRRT